MSGFDSLTAINLILANLIVLLSLPGVSGKVWGALKRKQKTYLRSRFGKKERQINDRKTYWEIDLRNQR